MDTTTYDYKGIKHTAEIGDIIHIHSSTYQCAKESMGYNALVTEKTHERIYFTVIEGPNTRYEDWTGWASDYYVVCTKEQRRIRAYPINIYQKQQEETLLKKAANKIKTMTNILTTAAKKFLDPKLQKLIKANFINNDLSLTNEGTEALMTILMNNNLEELAKTAEEKINEKTTR